MYKYLHTYLSFFCLLIRCGSLVPGDSVINSSASTKATHQPYQYCEDRGIEEEEEEGKQGEAGLTNVTSSTSAAEEQHVLHVRGLEQLVHLVLQGEERDLVSFTMVLNSRSMQGDFSSPAAHDAPRNAKDDADGVLFPIPILYVLSIHTYMYVDI